MTRERDEWASGVLREQGFCGSITAPGYVCIRAPHDHGEESMTPLDALTEALAAWYRCECSAVQKALGYECPHEVALVEACREGLPAMADLARKAAAADELRQALRRWLPARMDLIPDEMWGRLQPYWEQDDATLAAALEGEK